LADTARSAQDLRHAVAAAGVPAEDVRAVLNHARADVTGKHYDLTMRQGETRRPNPLGTNRRRNARPRPRTTSSPCAAQTVVVSKPTGKPVGRPSPRPPPPSHEQKLAQKFLHDPDRFGVALLDTMLALEWDRNAPVRPQLLRF
jgi:hypothetical protein